MNRRILPFPARELPATVAPAVAPLVGRATELAYLHQHLTAALQGQRQIVFLAGEPGIGKTALVDTFLAQLCGQPDLLVTTGHCVEQYGPGEAYLPLLEATTRLCRGPSGKRRLAALQRYAPSWLVQLPSLLEPQDLLRLQQHVHGMSRERMLREIAEAAEGLTLTHCLVLVLEDLHWSDVSTLDWLTYMARRREPAKLLILGTYRPTDALASGHPLSGMVQELQGRNQGDELRLAPLGTEGITKYLLERFAGEAGDHATFHDLAALVHRRTGGNPLFVVNTVEYFVRYGALTEEAGQWTLQPDKIRAIGDSIPDTIRQLIARQVERLPDTEQRVLEAASVAGAEFAVAEVAAGLQSEAAVVESVCEQLARTGQFVRASGLAEWPDGTISGRYSFLHALYQEVLSARLAELRRVQTHRRIAERKEQGYGERASEIAAELAMHYEQGRVLTRAVHYLGKAGENAVRRGAHREAIALLTQGVALLPSLLDTPERLHQDIQLHLALGVSFISTKGHAAAEVEQAFMRAWELSQQLDHTFYLFSALRGLSASYGMRAKFERASEFTEHLLAIAERAHDPEMRLEASVSAGMLHFYSYGDVLVALSHFARVRELYKPAQHRAHAARYGRDPGIIGRVIEALVLWCAGYPDQANQREQEALPLVQHEAAPYDQAIALIHKAFLHQHRREGCFVREPAEAVVGLATEHGLAFLLSLGTVLRGWALIEEGQLKQGIVAMERGIAATQALGIEIFLVYSLSLLVEAHRRAGHCAEGLRVLEDALVKVNTTGARLYEAELYRLKGELLLQQGARNWGLGAGEEKNPPSTTPPQSAIANPQCVAEECFLKAIAIAQQQHAKSWELRAALSLARLWQQQDKGDQARDLLEDIYTWFTEGFETQDLQDAEALLRALGSTVERQPATHDPHVQTQESQKSKIAIPQSAIVNPQSPIPRPQPVGVFRKEGDYWTITYQETSFRLRHLRGLDYIAHLLRHPDVEFLALDLLAPTPDPTGAAVAPRVALGDPSAPTSQFDGGEELLDSQARATYKHRLEELREELEEAQAFNDLGRVDKLQQEMDFLAAELARAVGLGGRARTTTTSAERARVNVAKGIRIALAKIAEQSPLLEHYLTTTIKTGLFCSYTPPPVNPISWDC